MRNRTRPTLQQTVFLGQISGGTYMQTAINADLHQIYGLMCLKQHQPTFRNVL